MKLASPPARAPAHLDPLVIGLACGLASAICYTGANIFLRQVAETRDPIWVSCVKTLPVSLVAWSLIARRRLQGHPVLPSLRVVLALVATGMAVQLVGNVANQWSLGQIGMALTVPLTLGTIITGGVLMGRIFLHEPIRPRSACALAVLILAIVVLSTGAGRAGASIEAASHDPPWVVLGVVAACCSGLAYAVSHVVIRGTVQGTTPVAVPLGIIASTGVVTLGILTLLVPGLDEVRQTTQANLISMILAGICNAAAFFALGKSLQYLSLVYVNAFNASQTALSAIAGVVLFGEAASLALVGGVLLTIGGLVLMRGNDRRIEAVEEAASLEATAARQDLAEA